MALSPLVPYDISIKPATIYGPDTCIDISDHFPIKIELPVIAEVNQIHLDVEYRNYKAIDINILKQNMIFKLNSNIINDISNFYDLEKATNFFNNSLLYEVDKQAPKINRVIKRTKHAVSNTLIIEARREKRRAEQKFRKTKSDQDKKKFRDARNKLNKVVTKSRNKFFQDKLATHKNDIRSTYKVVNQLLNKTKKPTFPDHTSELRLANKFAKFYKEKIQNIRKTFQSNFNTVNSPPSTRKVDNPFCFFEPITCEELLKVINELANKQSVSDVLPCHLFKEIAPELIPSLVKIINSSLRLGKFPSALKIGIVTPIIKSLSLDHNLLNNYRPVTILLILSKIFETCVLNQLSRHLEQNNLYPTFQSAYRCFHSCETALMKIIDDVTYDLNPNTYVLMTFLDFSAAFDTVDHTILIERLRNDYGIEDTALNWFESYLKERSYQVKINNTLSNVQSLSFGVPQGSILGPILYILYVKDIEAIAQKHQIKVHIYADDVQLYVPCNSSSTFDNLRKCLLEIQEWATNNYLKLNQDKTQILCISSKNCTCTKPQQLNVMGELINVKTSAKYLGIWLDEHLSFTKQINQVCSQGYGTLRNLWKISSKILDINLRTQLIHTFILSKLNFCNALYFSLPKKELAKLDKLLKAGVRFIFKLNRTYVQTDGTYIVQHMTPYLQELHFLPISYRLDFKICLMVYKCFNNKAPEYLSNLLIPRKNVVLGTRLDDDKTRLKSHPLQKLNYKNRSFRYAAPDRWNKLNKEIRESPTIDCFKKKLKTHFFEKWLTGSALRG